MLDGLWLEFTTLFTDIYRHFGVTYNGMALSADLWGHLAVGIVGLLAVSAPFVVAYKLINLVCGGVYK